MKLMVPTLDDRGLQATPSDHFGSAPFFTFVETESGEVQVIRNGNAHHVHGSCQPLAALDGHPVEAVLCRGIGRRAYSRLRADGIRVLVTLERDVEASVDAFGRGWLKEMTSEAACHGHGQGAGVGPGRSRMFR